MSALNPAQQKIRSLVFDKLAYEPVLDSDSALKAWIGAHPNNVFAPFINGNYASLSEKQLAAAKPVTNPSNGSALAKVAPCDKELFAQAVESGLQSAASWKALSQTERGRIIYNIARNYQKHLQISVACESVPTGRTSRECKELDVTQVIKTLYHFAGSLGYEAECSEHSPVGIVAIAGFYDSPLSSLATKVAPALATGNACLIVPHQKSSLGAFLFAEICEQSGVPPGVVSVLVGGGDEANEELLGWVANEPRIGAIAFDGRLSRGQELIRKSSVSPSQRVLVSCEAKSSLLVYESADFDSAIEAVVEGCTYSNGQHRYSLNKLFIQESVFDDFVPRLEARFRKIRIGNHLDKCNDLGAMLTLDDSKLIKDYIDSKLADQGAKVEKFSECVTDSNNNSIVSPVIIKDLGLNSEFNLNEVNGPYVILQKFRTVKESVELINNSRLAGAVSVFSQDISLVLEVASLLNVGTVWVNSFQAEKGVQTRKQSGNFQISGSRNLRSFLRANWEPVFESSATSQDDLNKTIKQFGSQDPAAASPLSKGVELEQTYKLYVGGKQTRPDTQASRSVFKHGSSKEVYCLVPDASRKDVRNAVEAANSAFGSWSKRGNFNKAQILYYFGENLQSRTDSLASKLEKVTGKSVGECQAEIKLCLDVIFHFAATCDKQTGRLNDPSEYGFTLESNEPLGCVAIVCGHDYAKSSNRPLLTLITHLIGAISTGNTVIVVPDEHCVVPGLDLYEIFDTSDMPPGVVNLLSGDKRHLAKHLAEHQQVSAVWYLCDVNADEAVSKVRDEEKAAVQFVKFTSSHSVKRTWFPKSRVLLESSASGVKRAYLNEIAFNSTQSKIIHCPMGTIFAN